MDSQIRPPSASPATAIRILIVEDEGLVAMDLQDRLSRMGYEVAGLADTAEDAVHLAQSSRIDLVLMDIHLRGKGDGIDAAGRIRRTVDVPVIFVTAHADDATLQHAGQTEAFGFVLKPFDERDLRTNIEMALYRHRAEARLRRMERWLATTMASIGDGVIATDSDMRVIYVNAMAEALAGWTRGAAIGRPLSEVFAVEGLKGERVDLVPQLLDDVIEEGLIVNVGEGRMLRRRDHGLVPVDDSIAPIRDDDGTTTGCVVVFRDATARLEAEEERRKLQDKMHEAQRLEGLGVLAGGIAHDFNNFLGAIMLNASFCLTQVPGNEAAQNCLRDIVTAGERASQLCKQMMAYARQEPAVLEAVDLNAFTRETAHLLEVAISKNSALILDLGAGLRPVSADRGLLQQIIMNLIINASEALAGQPGEIVLRTGLEQIESETIAQFQVGADLPGGEYLVLEVRDTGCGMSPETLARIFDPFFTTKFTGRGLGLAAVMGIVRTHHGALAVESTPGGGSIFRVYLPAAQGPVRVNGKTVISSAWRGEGRALLIDDESPVRAAGTAVLRHLGFEVDVARDGEEGLAKVMAMGDMLRLVLLDLTMPKLDGRKVLAFIRQKFPDLPVVLTSGYSEHQLTQPLHLHGPTAFLQKPFTLQDLVAKIPTVCRW